MTTLEAQWTPAKNLILGDDPQRRVHAEVSIWFKKIELFRQSEDERMFVEKPAAEDLELHKAMLRRLITDGDHVQALVQQVGLPENVERITPECVGATLELLRADYRGWHEPMPPKKRDQILREVFPDVA